MSSRSALLLGSTGLVGGHCLKLLLNDNTYKKVITVARRTLPMEHPKLEQCLIDFNSPEDSAQLLKADDIFCCLGTTMKKAGTKEAFYKVDFTYPHQIAQLTLKIGAERFLIVTSVGADPNSSNFYLKVKGEIESAISKLPFKAIHILRPSLLLGNRGEVRLGEKLGMISSKALSFMLIGGLKKYRPIEAEVVAFAMTQLVKSDLKGIHIHESDEIQNIHDQNRA